MQIQNISVCVKRSGWSETFTSWVQKEFLRCQRGFCAFQDKLESVLDVSHQQMEEYRDQPTHAEKISYQQKLLQEDVVRIRAGISQVSTVRASPRKDRKVQTAASPTGPTTCPSFYKVILVVSSWRACHFLCFVGVGWCSLLFFTCCFLIVCTWRTVSGWLWLSGWVTGDEPGASKKLQCILLKMFSDI